MSNKPEVAKLQCMAKLPNPTVYNLLNLQVQSPPSPNTADLGIEEKAAVMGGGIGGGEAVLRGAVLWGGERLYTNYTIYTSNKTL